MVIAISLLSILLCAVFYAAAMTLSTSSVTNAMEESLHGITQQGAELIHARVDSKYKELSAIATNDLFWSEYISESRLYSLLDRARELEGYLELVFVSKAGTAYSSKGTSSPIGESESFRAGMAGNKYVSEPTIMRLLRDHGFAPGPLRKLSFERVCRKLMEARRES